MDFGSNRLYEIELWSQSGVQIADISTLCTNRSYTLQRNEAETLSFTLDLFKFESYCKTHLGGIDPSTLLAAYVTDVKVKRAGQYLFGAQVVDVNFDFPIDSSAPSAGGSSTSYPVVITCTGYLNFFKDRYTDNVYSATEPTSIASGIITTTQSQVNGSVGVTIAPTQYVTGFPMDRTYQRDNIKLKLQELTTLDGQQFDFAFTWDKKFQTYEQIGARRSDLSFIWGGPLSNVPGFSLDRSAMSLFNKVYGVGSGSGPDQLLSIQIDNPSELNYYVRETIAQFNSVLDQATLDQNTLSTLMLAKAVLELPVITLTTAQLNGTFLSVGDRLPLQVNDHKWLASINGLYRVEKIDVTPDDNDNETITLTFDNFGVNQDE